MLGVHTRSYSTITRARRRNWHQRRALRAHEHAKIRHAGVSDGAKSAEIYEFRRRRHPIAALRRKLTMQDKFFVAMVAHHEVVVHIFGKAVTLIKTLGP